MAEGARRAGRLNVGLVGLGRLGRVYARDLATRVPSARLVAVADVRRAVAEEIAAEYGVDRWYAAASDLVADPHVEAVVLVTPTDTHAGLTAEAAARGKAVFCEKPPALSLAEALEMKRAAERAGSFLQIGFMRRFDTGYAAARRQVAEGVIGEPVMFKATSRDPYPPPVDYADPRKSGGMIVDMGIHDFDLAGWFMGPIARVQAVGGALACPELAEVGDIDTAIVSLVFATGRLGVVDLARNGVYGYDIATEILGTAGALRVGYLRETPLLVMTKQGIAHDTVPYFMERFRDAYVTQLEDFAGNVLHQRPPSVTIDDGIASLRAGLAATLACRSGEPVAVASVMI